MALSLCRHTSFKQLAALQSVTSYVRHLTTKKMGLPRVYFDMAIDNVPAGRIVIDVSKNSYVIISY